MLILVQQLSYAVDNRHDYLPDKPGNFEHVIFTGIAGEQIGRVESFRFGRPRFSLGRENGRQKKHNRI